MKTADCDILIVPGRGNAGPDHWLSRWERKLPTARRVEQDDWDWPERTAWVRHLRESVAASSRPVVLIAHALGVATVAFAAADFPRGRVRAGFLVAPADAAASGDFDGLPEDPLPFPSMMIASRTDPACPFERADEWAAAWGSLLVDAGDAGPIDPTSGHGPWPEGLTRFATLMARV